MPSRGKKIRESYDNEATNIEELGKQTQQALRSNQLGYEDLANKAQEQYNQQMEAARQAEANRWANYAGGVEAIIAERQKELDRAKEVANAEFMASQKAGLASGLTHLAASLGNLIGTGFFNASHSEYQNPALDWMKKADQDRLINRQRIDNMREKQRAVQQQLLEIRSQGEGALAALDREQAGQGYQHGMGIAQTRLNTDNSAAQIGLNVGLQAGQTRLQGANTEMQADYQDAQMEQNERHFQQQMEANERRYREQNATTLARYGLQMDPNTGEIKPILGPNGQPIGASGVGSGLGSSRTSSGSGGSGNNYKVTVDGKEAVIRMGTETYKSAVLRGRNEIKKDIMEEAGFNGSWKEFKEAVNAKGKNNKYADYGSIVGALDSDATDADTIKDNTAAIEDYINNHTDTSNHFNRYLMDLASSGQIIATVDDQTSAQKTEQANAAASVTPSQQRANNGGRVPDQPTRVEMRNGQYVTVDSATGEVIGPWQSPVAPQAAQMPQTSQAAGNWEERDEWK